MNGVVSTMLIIAGSVILSITIAAPIHWHVYKRYHYTCSKCQKSFKPATFLGSMFALNGGDQRKMRCPYCNFNGWMEMEKDN